MPERIGTALELLLRSPPTTSSRRSPATRSTASVSWPPAWIGSFNFDPRSANINTEAGLFIESPELAAQLAGHMAEGVRLDNAYRVQLDPSGGLFWVTEDAGKEVRYDVDPLSTPQQRLEAGWIRMLPIEDQL